MKALFPVAMWAFHKFDRTVLASLPERHRTRAYDLAFQAKNRLFPGIRRKDVNPDAYRAEPPRPRDVPKIIPAWLEEEICSLRKEIDPSLPIPAAIKGADRHFRHPGLFRTGCSYAKAASAWPRGATHVILVPWLKTGGADLVAIRHAEALANLIGNRVLVVSTDVAESPWRSRLPPTVAFFELGPHVSGLTDAEATEVLVRLLLQYPPSVLHVFPSRLGWKVLARNGKALSQSTRLYASSFCEDGHSMEGIPFGYADEFLDEAARHLTRVLSDNAAHPRRLTELLGVSRDLFAVVPVPADFATPTPVPTPGASRVLWAGRLDWQKCPELLVEIASAMPDIEFHVYGSKVLRTDAKALRRLERLPNVRMAGGFDGFSSIPDLGWGCLLYTSRWDGMPNVLLEAGSRGFPIVASDVGGISELIGPSTGWLVKGGSSDFVEAIRDCLATPETAAARGNALAAAVRTRHDPNALSVNLSRIPGYVSPTPGPTAFAEPGVLVGPTPAPTSRKDQCAHQ